MILPYLVLQPVDSFLAAGYLILWVQPIHFIISTPFFIGVLLMISGDVEINPSPHGEDNVNVLYAKICREERLSSLSPRRLATGLCMLYKMHSNNSNNRHY